MNIEDKLPKAEDVVKEYLDKSYTIDEIKTSVHIIKAMHEYARRLLDVAAESAEAEIIFDKFGDPESQVNKQSILKLKEMLK